MKSPSIVAISLLIGSIVGFSIHELIPSNERQSFVYQPEPFIVNLAGGGFDFLRVGFTLHSRADLALDELQKEQFRNVINGVLRMNSRKSAIQFQFNSNPLRDELIEALQSDFPGFGIYDLRFYQLLVQ